MVENESENKYMWCLHCNRTYKNGESRKVPENWDEEDIKFFRKQKLSEVEIVIMKEPLEMCPYEGCSGDIVWDSFSWETILERHPEYPVIPVKDIIYRD